MLVACSNTTQQERLLVQKECLSGNSPESCVKLGDLYEFEEYLFSDDLAFIQTFKAYRTIE